MLDVLIKECNKWINNELKFKESVRDFSEYTTALAILGPRATAEELKEALSLLSEDTSAKFYEQIMLHRDSVTYEVFRSPNSYGWAREVLHRINDKLEIGK